MVYFVKYDGQHKTTDNEIYYTYKVLVDGKEEIVKADSQVLGTSTLYSAYYKARTNSDDEITTILPMPTGAGEKFIAADGVSNGLSYSAGTLTVGSKGYTLADNCKITLVGPEVRQRDEQGQERRLRGPDRHRQGAERPGQGLQCDLQLRAEGH